METKTLTELENGREWRVEPVENQSTDTGQSYIITLMMFTATFS